MLVHIHTQAHAHMHTHVHAHVCTHACPHAHAHIHTHAHMSARMSACTHVHVCTRTYPHAHPHTCTHTHPHRQCIPLTPFSQRSGPSTPRAQRHRHPSSGKEAGNQVSGCPPQLTPPHSLSVTLRSPTASQGSSQTTREVGCPVLWRRGC